MQISDVSSATQLRLEVKAPDGSRKSVQVLELPFLMGRGSDTGNHLQLSDPRISRHCCAIVTGPEGLYLEDRGHHRGIFINGGKIHRALLRRGDVITFGLDNSFELTIESDVNETAVSGLLTLIGQVPGVEDSSGGLHKLNVLLQATSLLHSDLPLDSILSTMLDQAIAITGADRGALFEPDFSGILCARLARGKGGLAFPPTSVTPSQTALRQALEQRSSVVTQDLNRADAALQMAQSIVAQSLRAVIVIPLYSSPHGNSNVARGEAQLLGVAYLDSRRPTAFSRLDREILDALAAEAASILDNARLVERERQRQRLEQELNIAREIQQALVPHGFRNFSHCAVGGIHTPCHAVGGDYFDVFPLDEERTAILVADVSGKGLGAALLTTMLQGAFSGMTTGTDPVLVINHLNRFLCEHSEVGRYATMFFGILDSNGGFVYINAGHLSPLVLREGEVTELTTEGSFPVGLIPEATYESKAAALESGDTLILFSDGITEAMNTAEEMFGSTRLQQALSAQRNTSLEELQKAVLAPLEQFTRGANQSDDITLLIVRYRAASQAATAVEGRATTI
ncbi:MAG: SpoIIE family protein phosphatase [Acidobacteriota bacterium]|nr:SpoIIE family protein phosphatase [Acidobacteriota bacterium]